MTQQEIRDKFAALRAAIEGDDEKAGARAALAIGEAVALDLNRLADAAEQITRRVYVEKIEE